MQVQIHQWSALDPETRARLLSRSETAISELIEPVSRIVSDVMERGDNALREFTARFDGVELSADAIRVSEEDVSTGIKSLPAHVRKSIDYAIENVRKTHERQRPPAFSLEEVRPGVSNGERHVPIDSVGLYVPRGRGSFPSMLYMLAVPAQIAGVPRVCVVTPPGTDGTVDPACLYAARSCGVQEIFRIGGAQAIAALAYGTQTVRPVAKIVGPGSAYVAAAKRLVRDVVDTGLPAGPSESIILADSSADAFTVSRDLLIEAEHGADSQALLVTTDTGLAKDVAAEVAALISATPRPRRDFLEAVFAGYGGIVLTDSMSDAVDLVNRFAPEHLQLRLSDPWATVESITNAGEILVGKHTPFSLANYAIGSNAVLPTGGGARIYSGVAVADFMKSIAVMEVTQSGYDAIATSVIPLAEYEGFHWHAEALRNRNR